MTEGGDWVELEDYYSYYTNIYDYFFNNISESISKYTFMKLNYFNNIFVNSCNIFFIILLLNKNSLLNFKCAIDLIGIDFYYKFRRFKLVYTLLNIFNSKRSCVFTSLAETSYIHTVSSVYQSFNWSEREIWDMFGIFFINNNNLRRILNDYGFKGYPLRKDFPLTGFIELYYNNSLLDICYRPVQLSQELRFFNFSSCWDDDSSAINKI